MTEINDEYDNIIYNLNIKDKYLELFFQSTDYFINNRTNIYFHIFNITNFPNYTFNDNLNYFQERLPEHVPQIPTPPTEVLLSNLNFYYNVGTITLPFHQIYQDPNPTLDETYTKIKNCYYLFLHYILYSTNYREYIDIFERLLNTHRDPTNILYNGQYRTDEYIVETKRLIDEFIDKEYINAFKNNAKDNNIKIYKKFIDDTIYHYIDPSNINENFNIPIGTYLNPFDKYFYITLLMFIYSNIFQKYQEFLLYYYICEINNLPDDEKVKNDILFNNKKYIYQLYFINLNVEIETTNPNQDYFEEKETDTKHQDKPINYTTYVDDSYTRRDILMSELNNVNVKITAVKRKTKSVVDATIKSKTNYVKLILSSACHFEQINYKGSNYNDFYIFLTIEFIFRYDNITLNNPLVDIVVKYYINYDTKLYMNTNFISNIERQKGTENQSVIQFNTNIFKNFLEIVNVFNIFPNYNYLFKNRTNKFYSRNRINNFLLIGEKFTISKFIHKIIFNNTYNYYKSEETLKENILFNDGAIVLVSIYRTAYTTNVVDYDEFHHYPTQTLYDTNNSNTFDNIRFCYCYKITLIHSGLEYNTLANFKIWKKSDDINIQEDDYIFYDKHGEFDNLNQFSDIILFQNLKTHETDENDSFLGYLNNYYFIISSQSLQSTQSTQSTQSAQSTQNIIDTITTTMQNTTSKLTEHFIDTYQLDGEDNIQQEKKIKFIGISDLIESRQTLFIILHKMIENENLMRIFFLYYNIDINPLNNINVLRNMSEYPDNSYFVNKCQIFVIPNLNNKNDTFVNDNDPIIYNYNLDFNQLIIPIDTIIKKYYQNLINFKINYELMSTFVKTNLLIIPYKNRPDIKFYFIINWHYYSIFYGLNTLQSNTPPYITKNSPLDTKREKIYRTKKNNIFNCLEYVYYFFKNIQFQNNFDNMPINITQDDVNLITNVNNDNDDLNTKYTDFIN